MQKDEYAKLKARQDVVTAFINKLEKADISDIGLIPALMDYVNTGDKSMFEEYNQFHSIKDLEEKATLIAERTERAKKSVEYEKQHYEEWEERLRKAEKITEDYRNGMQEEWRKYQALIMETDAKKNEVREDIAKITPAIEQPTMASLIAFCERVTKEVKQGKQRRLWMKWGKTIKPVKSFIILDDGKAVFEVESEDLKTP